MCCPNQDSLRMKEVTSNDYSGSVVITWASPGQTLPITDGCGDGRDQSVQHRGAVGGAVNMEGIPARVGMELAAAELWPASFSSLPSAQPHCHYSTQKKAPGPSLVSKLHGFLWG